MVMQSLNEVIDLKSERAKKEERKHRIIAFSISTVTHILILLVLLYFGFKAPDPPLDTVGGVAVVLGTTETGMIETFEQVSKPEPQPETGQEKPKEEEILTEESADVPAVVKKKEEKKQEETPVEKQPEKKEEPKEPVRSADPNTLFQKGTTTSKGTGNQPGDQGKKEGKVDARSWQGGAHDGDGDGFGIEGMGGRGLKTPPRLNDDTQREGKIVVSIVVDREGNVIEARGGIRGTTINDYNLITKAEEAARRTKFSPDPNAQEKQYGKISFNFKLE